MYQKVTQDQTLDIKSILFGSEKSDTKMQKLLDSSNQILSGNYCTL